MIVAKEDISELMTRLESKIVDAKTDMIKWRFFFWTSYTLIILGSLFTFLKFFLDK